MKIVLRYSHIVESFLSHCLLMLWPSLMMLQIWSCTSDGEIGRNHEEKYIESAVFGRILDSAGLKGTIITYQPATGIWLSNDFNRSDSGFIPASTFKIPNTLIGLATGIIDTQVVFQWDSMPRRLKIWEKNHTLRDAFHHSCVPCYQELAISIGVDSMKHYLNLLEYGNMDVNTENLHLFWLEGESRISPKAQILFLSRLYEESLPVERSAMVAVKHLMKMESGENYSLYGKTGWAIRDGHNTGWFVGWVESMVGVVFFATNIEPDESFNMAFFNKIRSEVTLKALKAEGLL